jgi:excisionase family DNA binding protein
MPEIGQLYSTPAFSNSNSKLLFTFDEASDALSISRAMLRKLARTGRMKVVRIGRSVRISMDELRRLSGNQELGGNR